MELYAILARIILSLHLTFSVSAQGNYMELYMPFGKEYPEHTPFGEGSGQEHYAFAS
jgi:hypothetical protein